MRVLITGATGLLGATLAPALELRGHVVVRHGRRAGDVRGDITVPDVVEQLVAGERPGAVINLAALTNVDQCESDPNAAFLQNTRIVENLANAIETRGNGCRLLQVSTDHVYDGVGPHGEEAVHLVNYYAFSKYAGERAAARISGTIVRTNFFGPSQASGQHSFSDWIVGALTRRETVRVFDDVFFSPLSMAALSGYIAHMMESGVPGTFNVGSRDGMSKAQFCFALAAALGLPTDTMHHALSTDRAHAARRPKDMRMNCDRFQERFGVQLPSLQQEIESMRSHYHAGA
jgi:dTDP-4-dehydrorhamnose reductase